jgi:hypothetical protein
MKQVIFGFYGEGVRDYGFMQAIVRRTIEAQIPTHTILAQPLERLAGKQDERIVAIARQAHGLNFVVLHLDADAPNFQQAYEQRFLPGYQKVQRDTAEDINHEIVPVIPVRVTEAWMLVDFEAFKVITRTQHKSHELGFPAKHAQVEKLPAKSVFEQAVRDCQSGKKRRPLPLDRIYLPLAEHIKLELLRKVPAYQEFERRLLETLRTLRLVED